MLYVMYIFIKINFRDLIVRMTPSQQLITGDETPKGKAGILAECNGRWTHLHYSICNLSLSLSHVISYKFYQMITAFFGN